MPDWRIQTPDEPFRSGLNLGAGLNWRMAKRPTYYIACFKADDSPLPWAWELRRTREPMGVKVSERGYESKTEADHAGKIALERFLEALEKERRVRG